ncbi:RNA polymerase sigma factor [Longitalea arenae]|uniref:RNA polymerase sigma factor n=1 Tax=Longitalea arenae TaxID=2812558 RepID=UPI00210441F2|nr:RNA polymerase sigma-70 factor [Longitalea arenae]
MKSSQFTEIQIIDGLKNNDSRVFDHLFNEYYTQLQYFAERLVSNREEAQDIVITVFRKFWSIKDNFQTINNIKAFFYITVRNQCLDFLRYRQRLNEVKKEYESHLLTADELKQSEHLIIETDLINKIYKEVQKLPNRCREIFILTYFKGLKTKEIASALQISESAVTTQRSLAIKYLKHAFSQEGYVFFCLVLAGMDV